MVHAGLQVLQVTVRSGQEILDRFLKIQRDVFECAFGILQYV